MNLYFDLDAGIFVSGPGTRDRVDRLAFKRGDTISIALRFLRGIVVQELPSGATGEIGLKEIGEYDADLVAGASSWVKTGTTTTTVYTFQLGLNTAEINTLLAHDGTEGNDVASVDLMFELQFIAAGIITSSPTLTCTIQNDVIKNADLVPAPSAGQAPLFRNSPPISASEELPATLTITGITDPAESDPLVLAINADDILNSLRVWSDGTWSAQSNGSQWAIQKGDGTEYLATKASVATSPVGLTTWTVVNGTGQPTVAGSAQDFVTAALPGRIAVVDTEMFVFIATGENEWSKLALA